MKVRTIAAAVLLSIGAVAAPAAPQQVIMFTSPQDSDTIHRGRGTISVILARSPSVTSDTIYLDGTLLATQTPDGSGKWPSLGLDTSTMAAGPHKLSAVAKDSGGNQIGSEDILLVVDLTLPTPTPGAR